MTTRKQLDYVTVKFKCKCGKVEKVLTRCAKQTLNKKKRCEDCQYQVVKIRNRNAKRKVKTILKKVLTFKNKGDILKTVK